MGANNAQNGLIMSGGEKTQEEDGDGARKSHGTKMSNSQSNPGPVLRRRPSDASNKNISKTSMNKDYLYYYNGVIKYFKTQDTNYFANLYRDHFKHTFVSLQFCRNLKPPKKSDLISRRTTLVRRACDFNKKTLVLDLDETLIHCNTNRPQQTDLLLPIQFPSGDRIEAPVNLRPYVSNFLEEMAP